MSLLPWPTQPDAPTQEGVDRKRQIAEALSRIGQQGTGLGGPWGGIASALAGGLSGFAQSKAGEQQKMLDDDRKAKIARALAGLAPKSTNPAALDIITSLPLQQQQQVAGQLALGQLKPAPLPEAFTLSKDQARYGPDGKIIATGPVPAPEPYTLAPGASRFGPDNKPLASVPNAPTPTTNISLNTEKGLYGTLAEKQAGQYSDLYSQAQQAPERIDRAARVRQLLATQPITGAGAEQKLAIARALKSAGLYDNEDIANTELLGRELAGSTLEAIKSSGLGGGSGFSNADRDFLEKITGGSIALDASTLGRVAELNERSARNTVNRWNETAKKLRPDQLKNLGMSAIELPPALPKTSGRPDDAAQVIEQLKNDPKYSQYFQTP